MYAKCPLCSTDTGAGESESESTYSGVITFVRTCPACGITFKVEIEEDVWKVAKHWLAKEKDE